MSYPPEELKQMLIDNDRVLGAFDEIHRLRVEVTLLDEQLADLLKRLAKARLNYSAARRQLAFFLMEREETTAFIGDADETDVNTVDDPMEF